MKILFSLVLVSLVACTSPHEDVGAVRAHVIDSLKLIYELNQANKIPEVSHKVHKPEPKMVIPEQATVTSAPATEETWTSKDGTLYQVHTGKKGGRYIMRTSKTTGKEYKSYIK